MYTSRGHAGVLPTSRRNCLEIAIAPSAVRIARQWTADQLAAEPAVRGDLVDSAILAVSELVTNAIRAVRGTWRLGDLTLADPRVALVITRLDDAVRIEVYDSCCAALPSAGRRSEDDESGRGLTVVSALAADWGWQPDAAGKVVWCELGC